VPSHPFYPKDVHLPIADDPVSPMICENSKFWPYFKDVLEALDGSHIQSSPPPNEHTASQNHKNFYLKIVYLVVHLSSSLSIIIPGGRVQQLMHTYTRLHSWMAWTSLRISIIWLML
jgi:hypothetical protein